MPKPQKHVVVVKSGNSASLTLGIIATIVGVIALLVSWVPFLGLLSIPFACLGGLLAVVGVIVAMVKRCEGIALPLVGGLICTFAIGLSIMSTGTTAAVITEAAEQAKASRLATVQQQAAKVSDYLEKLEIYDVDSKYRPSASGSRSASVQFKIRNNGDRTLTRIEVTVYFLNASGAPIAEEVFVPVRVNPYAASAARPLRPGYVWELEGNRTMTTRSIPSEWVEGSVEVKFTGLEFERSRPPT